MPDVEGGILPPGIRILMGGDLQTFRAHEIAVVLSAGLEARLYGRQGCPPLQFKLDKFFGSAWLAAMKIPEFKASKRFLGDTHLSCLVATVKNSELPPIATRHIAEFKKDPICKIYLRGADPKRISPWQQKMLEQLFANDGLAAAVAEGMKEFESAGIDKCYCDFDEDERQFIRNNTILPFLTIRCVAIDDIGQKVLISANNNDGVLAEHGITIFLEAGRWRFEDADHLIRYSSEVTAEWEAKKADKWRKKWEAVFPPPEPDAPVETGGTTLCGVWRPSKQEEAKALKLIGAPASAVEAALGPSSLDITTGMYFSPATMEDLLNGYTSNEYEILSYERKGTKLVIQVLKTFYNGDKANVSYEFWYDGKRLVQTSENNVVVLVRGEDSYRIGDISPHDKLMNERSAQKKARAALQKQLTDNAG